MRVRDLMKTPVTTVSPDDSLHVADGLMSLGELRHLPVVREDRLVGILTHRDILRAPGLLAPVLGGVEAGTRALLRVLRVEEAMTAAVVTIEAEASVPDAAQRLLEHKVGCLPVLEEGRLVGIVTTSDLLRAVAGPLEEASHRSSAAPEARGVRERSLVGYGL